MVGRRVDEVRRERRIPRARVEAGAVATQDELGLLALVQVAQAARRPQRIAEQRQRCGRELLGRAEVAMSDRHVDRRAMRKRDREPDGIGGEARAARRDQ